MQSDPAPHTADPTSAETTATRALKALRGSYPAFVPGTVWLVGAGPGDPGLLTLDALAGLVQADVVVHDALVDARVLALARPGAQLRFAGKRGGKPSIPQQDISALLVGLAQEGLRVLRLKGGDPFVFGRGGEEMLALASAGIPVRVVPGVTAGLGALASAWIPATMRGVSQAIIFTTGHTAEDDHSTDWAALARTGHPIVIYMGLRNLDAISAALIRGGLRPDTPAAVVAAGTLPTQQVVVSTLARLPDEAHRTQIEAPAIVVIGDIVRTRQHLLEAVRLQNAPAVSASTSAARVPCEG